VENISLPNASSFTFKSYLVNIFNLDVKGFSENTLKLLQPGEKPLTGEWSFEVALIHPQYSKSAKVYTCGVKVKSTLRYLLEDKLGDPYCTLEAGIVGQFQADGELSKEIEENIVKYQAPTILFPYLRGAITTFLATAGFGTVLIPLVNMNKTAEISLKDIPIKVSE
jgi:preprotein translocase subunit SecB